MRRAEERWGEALHERAEHTSFGRPPRTRRVASGVLGGSRSSTPECVASDIDAPESDAREVVAPPCPQTPAGGTHLLRRLRSACLLHGSWRWAAREVSMHPRRSESRTAEGWCPRPSP
jgi:hypothetical protein